MFCGVCSYYRHEKKISYVLLKSLWERDTQMADHIYRKEDPTKFAFSFPKVIPSSHISTPLFSSLPLNAPSFTNQGLTHILLISTS